MIIQVTVKHSDNTVAAVVSGTQEEMDLYISEIPATLPVTSETAPGEGVIFTTEESQEFDSATSTYKTKTLYHYEEASGYTYETEDITEKTARVNGVNKNIKRIYFFQGLMAEFAYRNQKRIAALEITVPQVIALEEATAKFQRLGNNSSLSLALTELNTLSDSSLPEGEKVYFVDKIVQYLSTEG